MLLKGTPDLQELRTFFRWLWHDPITIIVAKGLNGQEGLTVYDELTENVWCRKHKPPLLSNDFGARDWGRNPWDRVAAKKKIADYETGKVPVLFSQVPSLHDGYR